MAPRPPVPAGPAGLDRRIWALAAPAFLALVAEPLFLLADSAIVGHLGTTELAGLGIASVVLRLVVGLCVFLAYGTTASVARELGAGRRDAALRDGVDGLWLAAVVGVVLTAGGLLLTEPAVAAFGAGEGVGAAARTYLAVSWWGLTPMLLVLAATGVLRGLHDTRTPLLVAVVANLANIALNVVLVYGVGLGILGAALGTVMAQTGAAVALVLRLGRESRRRGVALRPRRTGLQRSARAGSALLVRTATLHVCLLGMTWAAARYGETALAAHQLAFAVWTFLAYALDALAIAAQALVGTALGSGDVAQTRAVTRRLIRLGAVAGVVTGVLLALAAPVLGWLFVDDGAVVRSLAVVLLVAALAQPLAGVVFVLDGILIGAGDARYLAGAGTVVTAAFVPVLAAVVALVPASAPTAGLLWLWVGFSLVFMGGRALVLVRRARGSAWLVVGSAAEERVGD